MILLIVFVYWGILTQATPKVVVGSGTQYRPISQYATVVNSSLLNRLRDSNKLTYDGNSITQSLTRAFPEIDSATVELPLVGRQPVVRLDISAPALLMNIDPSNPLIVSSSGKAISPNDELASQYAQLPLLLDQSGLPTTEGAQILSPGQVSFIKVLAKQSQHADIAIKSFDLPPAADEVDMHLKNQPYYVKFYMGGDPVGEAGSFFATYHRLKHQHITPAEYVDVRVAGKVFYK